MFLTAVQKTLIFRFGVVLGVTVVTSIVILLVHPDSPIALPSSSPNALPSSPPDPATDVDECRNRIHNCDDQFGICTNTIGSFTCRCIQNWAGDGVNCYENECLTGRHNCHVNATCTDTVAGFYCTCKGSSDNKWPGSRGLNPPFYAGNGTQCDFNQCAAGPCIPPNTRNCNECFVYPNRSFVDPSISANCTDLPDIAGTEGYTCKCLGGFVTDSAKGKSCTAEDSTTLCGSSPCDKNTTTCVSDLYLDRPPLFDYGKPRPGMDPACKVAFPYCCDCKYPRNQTRIKCVRFLACFSTKHHILTMFHSSTHCSPPSPTYLQ
jgi:hypothetical protein